MAPKVKHEPDDTDGASNRNVRRKMDEAPTEASLTTVIVGEGSEKELFHMKRSILIKHSDYCFAELDKPKAGKAHIIRLPDVDPKDFTIFKNFLHGGKIYSSKTGDASWSKGPNPKCYDDKEWMPGSLVTISNPLPTRTARLYPSDQPIRQAPEVQIT